MRAHELIDAVSQVGPARAFTLQQGSPFPRFGDGNDGGKQVELVHRNWSSDSLSGIGERKAQSRGKNSQRIFPDARSDGS